MTKHLLLAAVLSVAGLAAPVLAQEAAEQPATKAEDNAVLSIGDVAPKLAVEKFVKGTPVTAFEKGQVYVVEFWATWCGPCIKAFPHLSELQAEHKGKVTFIGVNVWERGYNDETFGKIEKFVEKQGEKMSYTVAYDGKDKNMDKAYMKAAGQDGIPAAFVVNGEGRIAWIGHPMGLDSVLNEVLAGKWDMEKARKDAADERAKEEAAMAARKKAQPIMTRLRTAQNEKNWDAAIKAMDELKAMDSTTYASIDVQKFTMLLLKAEKPDQAYAMKDTLLANKAVMDNAMALNQIAWSVVDPEIEVVKRDAEFALTFAAKADELTKHEDPAIMDTLARCYWVKGDKAKAIELQEKAVKLCDKDEKYAEMKDSLSEVLESYRKDAKN